MKKFKKSYIIIIILLILFTISGVILGTILKVRKGKHLSKVDDWKYVAQDSYELGLYSGQMVMEACDSVTTSVQSSYSKKLTSDANIGYTVGGASNAKNFRENIKNNYLPVTTDITYNGLYSEYYFDTGRSSDLQISNEKFYPTYSCAVSTDPLSNNMEYYLSVGLNSNLKESDFKRKKLNLVVVLDISGSMSSSFDSYYYDGNKNNDNKSKMKIAEECINNLIDNLNDDDRFGIVLFDDEAYLGKELNLISNTNIEAIKNHILEIEPQGGTNFSAGYNEGTRLFNEYKEDGEYQNRIIVITDAMPNVGNTTSEGLMKDIQENANKNIYTSLIGVGVDFNTDLIEKISDVKGANYYSVHSSKEFKKILDDEFDYMVTPIIFDLNLFFESDNFEIENIYGTDSANKNTGNIMHVNTLFPSSSNDNGEVKGGIIVLKLKKKQKDSLSKNITLKISYKDQDDQNYESKKTVEFKESTKDYYDNKGIEKAIVLARYVNTLKNWIIYERTNNDNFEINYNTGIKEFDYDEVYIRRILNENEKTSTKLTVSENYKEIFKILKKYIENENYNLNDETLKKEIEILNKLI